MSTFLDNTYSTLQGFGLKKNKEDFYSSMQDKTYRDKVFRALSLKNKVSDRDEFEDNYLNSSPKESVEEKKVVADTISVKIPAPVEVVNPYASMSDEELNTSLDVMRKGIESKSQEFDANNPIEKPSTPQGTPYGGYAMQGALAIQDAQARDNAKAKKEYLAEDYSKLVNSGEFKEYQKREREKIEAELKKLDELDNKIARENSDANIISGKYAGAGEIGLNRYARQLYEKALKTLDAPSEYDESWWLANVGRGALDRATDADLYSLGINEVLRNSALVPIARKVEEVKDKLDAKLESGKLSKEDAVKIMEDSFTESEKALINAYRYNEEVSQKRKDDLSYGYRSGQGIVDTGAFMMDYFLTGGISGGAKTAVKGGVKKVLKNKAGDIIGGALGTTAETAVRTAVLPHTYGMVTNEILNIDENTGKLNTTARAFALGMSEAFLTNLSETTGGIIPSTTKAILKNKSVVNLSSKILEKMGKTGERIANLKTKYDKSNFKKLGEALKEAGWHGTIDEWFEELDNAAFMYARGGVRDMIGDKGAEGDLSQLPEFFTAENQKVLIPTLLAPTAVKGAVTMPSAVKGRWKGNTEIEQSKPFSTESIENEDVSNDMLATITLDGKKITGRVSGKFEVGEDRQIKGFPVLTYVNEQGSIVVTPLNKDNLLNIRYLSELIPENEGDNINVDLSEYIDENGEPTYEGRKNGIIGLSNNNVIVETTEGVNVPLTHIQILPYLERRRKLAARVHQALSYLNGLEQIEQQENEQANQGLSQEERDFVESLEDEREEAEELRNEEETPIEEPIKTPIEESAETPIEAPTETPVEETPSVESEEVASEEEVETPIEVNEDELNLETFTPKTILDVLDDDGMPTEYGKKLGVQSFEDGTYQVYNKDRDLEYSLDEGRMKVVIELDNQREKNAIDKRNREKKQAVIDAVKAERKSKEDAKKKVKEYTTAEPKVESVAEETPTENPMLQRIKRAIDNNISMDNVLKTQREELDKLLKKVEKDFSDENMQAYENKKKSITELESAYAEYQAQNAPKEEVATPAETPVVETPAVEQEVVNEEEQNVPLENEEEVVEVASQEEIENNEEETPSSEITIDKFFNETPQTANELTNFKAFANNNIEELSNDILSIVEERKSKNEGYKINGKSTKLGSFKSTQDIEALASGSNSNPISRWYNAAIEQQGKNIASAPNAEVRSLHVSQLESLESEYRRIKELAKEINKYNSRLSDLKDVKFKEGTEAERTTNFMPVNTDTYFDTMYKKGTKTKRIRLKGSESKDGKVISVYDVYGSDKELKLTKEEKDKFTSPMVKLYTKEGFIRYVQVKDTKDISGIFVDTFAEDGSNVGRLSLTNLYTDAETKKPLKERGKEMHDNTKDTPEQIIENTLRRISNKDKEASEIKKLDDAIKELEAKIKQTEEADIAYGRQTGEIGVNEYIVNLKRALEILQDRMNNAIAEEELQKVKEDREPTDEELNEIEQNIAENELKEGEELYKAVIEKIQAETDALDFSELLSVLSAEQRELFDNLDTLDKKHLAKLNGFTSAQIRFLEGNMEDRGFYRDQIDRAEKKLGKIDYANIPLSLINDEDYKVIFNLVNEEIPKAKGKIRKEALINRHIAMARQLGEEVKYKPIKKHITDEEIVNNQLLLKPIMHWLKGTGVKLHTTKKDFLEALSSEGKIGFFKTNKGIIYGFVKDGEIYLDPEELNPQTPIHEYSHLWLNAIRKVNKKLWERGVELAKQLPEWVELQQNSAYSFENEEELAEEVLSTYIGKNGTAQLEALVQRGDVPITIVQRIRKWISDVWTTLKGILDEWTDQDLSELTVDKLSAMAIRDLSEMTNVAEINEEMTSRNIVDGTYINEYEEMRSDFIAEIEKMKTEGNMSQYSIAKDKLHRIIKFAKERLDKKSELTKKEFSKIANEINKSITVYKNNFTGEINDRAIDRTADQLMNQLVKIDKLMSEVLEKQVDAEQSKVEDILHRAVEGLQKEKIKKGGMMTEYYAQSILDARKEFSLEEESYENLIVEIDNRIATIRDGEITNESIAELYALEAHKELLKVQETQARIDDVNSTLEEYREQRNELIEDRKVVKDEEIRKRMTRVINSLREDISLLETRLSAMQLEKVEHKRAYLMKCREIVYSGRADYLNKVRQREYENKKFLDEAIKEVKSGEVEDKIKSKPNKYTKILKSALDSLEMTIREVSVNIRDGRGSIYKRFIRSISDARNKTIETLQEEGDIINGVISNIFGYEYGKWYNVTKKARHSVESPIERLTQQSNNEVFGTITQTVKDLENGREVEKEIEYSITNGTAMYIYMSAKQKEGYSALLKDGFTKDEIERISDNLDARYKQFADWIQQEYMPKLYNRYDEKYYERYFIHLPRVENYFPLKTIEAANRQEILADAGSDATQFNAKTTVDNLFHRTGGSQIDIRNHNNNPNAVSILTNYVTRMEHWNQFVDIQNYANILLNSTHFRDNILRQSDGATKWNSFRIALIETVNEVAKGDRDFITSVVSAYMIGKIGLKPWNAFKQITSYPAFLAYATNKYVFYNLIKNLNPLNAFAQRNRAFRLFPCIKDRYYNSAMGHEMLSTEYNTDSYWWNKVNQWFSNTAILMNRTVDIITVSKGALAVYDGMKRQYIESGMSEAEADSEARIDAMIAYKATQQENTPEFLGSIQREHSTASSVAKAFNNSSFAFARLLYIESLIALKNLDRVNNPRMVELEVERVMKAHPEYSREQAETKANELMDKQILNSYQTLSAVGGGQLFFYLASAPSVLLNILSSSDDDNEKGWNAFLMILLRVGIVTPLGGIPFLGAMSDSVLTDNFKYYDVLSILPDSDLVMKGIKRFNNADTIGKKAAAIVGTIIEVLPLKIAGNTMYRMFDGIYNIIQNGDITTADVANILSMPPSEVQELIRHGYGDDESYINSYGWLDHLIERLD